METMKLINNIMIGPIKIFTLMPCNMKKKRLGFFDGEIFCGSGTKKGDASEGFCQVGKK